MRVRYNIGHYGITNNLAACALYIVSGPPDVNSFLSLLQLLAESES